MTKCYQYEQKHLHVRIEWHRACHSLQINICKKYRIYNNKHSGSIQIKEQYSPDQ